MNREIKKLLKIVEEKKRIDPQGKDRIADVLENREVDALPLIFWRPQNISVPGKTYDMEEQFYDKKALNAFGGGFVHFCGKNDYLLESFLNLNEVRAINLGNPEMYNFDITMQKFVKYRKCYFGLWPKEDSETLEGYIHRIKRATDGGKRGLILHFDEVMFPECSCQDILQKWRKIMSC